MTHTSDVFNLGITHSFVKPALADQEIFKHPKLWESSRVDGKTVDDLVCCIFNRPTFFLETRMHGDIMASTACEEVGYKMLDVHTFVLPQYINLSKEVLASHIGLFREHGYKHLFTCCSHKNMSVVNFLKKRLGFTVYKTKGSSITKDGEPLTLMHLHKELL